MLRGCSRFKTNSLVFVLKRLSLAEHSRKAFTDDIKVDLTEAIPLMKAVVETSPNKDAFSKGVESLEKATDPIRKEILSEARRILHLTIGEKSAARTDLSNWVQKNIKENYNRYSSHLHSQSDKAALKIKPVDPIYESNAETVDGRIVLRDMAAEKIERGVVPPANLPIPSQWLRANHNPSYTTTPGSVCFEKFPWRNATLVDDYPERGPTRAIVIKSLHRYFVHFQYTIKK